MTGPSSESKASSAISAEINHPGWTPLQYAALNGHNAVIEYLISTGADLALTAPNGATPAHSGTVCRNPFQNPLCAIPSSTRPAGRSVNGAAAAQYAASRCIASAISATVG